MLESMRKVGRGELYSGLLFDSSFAARKLLSLPPSQQRSAYNEPIEVVKHVDGKNIIEEKRLQTLSRAEANQVFDDENGRIRSSSEQLKYLKPEIIPARRAQQWDIIGDHVVVNARTEFNLSQILQIAELMKAAAFKSLPTAVKNNQLR